MNRSRYGLDSVYFNGRFACFDSFRKLRTAKRPLELQIGEYVALAYCGGSWIFLFFMAFSLFFKPHFPIFASGFFSLILCALFRLACFFMQSS